MLMLRKHSPAEAMMLLVAALLIGGLGTSLGLAAATLNDRDTRDDGAIHLVRPFHVEPELDRANHDQANH
jgi:hypothetical protein